MVEEHGAVFLAAPLLKRKIMIVYKCDGNLFSTGRKCSAEVTDELPERWLTINGRIENGLRDAHIIQANGTYHFCSRICFENFLFKDLNAASATTGNSNMNIDPKEGQEEVPNQPAEVALETIEPKENEGEGALVD